MNNIAKISAIETSASPPLTRNSLVWLFVAQVLILLPHFLAIPVWIPVIWFCVCIWRWNIFRGAWNYPTKWHKTIVVFICSSALIFSFGISFSLMAMVSLLSVGFILKLLEMKSQKDFLLLVFIAFFILATQFIFFNEFVAACYGFVCLLMLCSALLQLYQQVSLQQLWQGMRTSLFILLQAIPIMIVLFVVMPRLGAFWSMPSAEHAKTGMSDTMSPGDISSLIQSDDMVFRARFTTEIPAHEKLYWRSLVLSYFDGRRWSAAPFSKKDAQSSLQPISGWREKIDYRGDKAEYEIVAEPSDKPWLYVLGAAQLWNDDLFLSRDLHLQSFVPLNHRISYHVTSMLDYRLQVDEDEKDLQLNTYLPGTINPETRRIAREWFTEAGTTEKLIEKLFDYYRSTFFYTLQPPAFGNNFVDEFLWKSHQGFCEHFSSSFVFFLRAAGIPARVVVGYQGGELNTVEKYLTIRQRDAHAWAEVWIKDRGWVLYDPTAAVAPERIRRGITESLAPDDQKFLSRPFTDSFKIFLAIRNQWDALNFQWVRWVMNYDSNVQTNVLTTLLQSVTPLRIALFVLGVGLISLVFIFLLLFVKARYQNFRVENPASLVFKQLCKKLKKWNVSPMVGETPRQFIFRVIDVHPALAQPLRSIIDLYEQLAYAEDLSVQADLKSQIADLSV